MKLSAKEKSMIANALGYMSDEFKKSAKRWKRKNMPACEAGAIEAHGKYEALAFRFVKALRRAL